MKQRTPSGLKTLPAVIGTTLLLTGIITAEEPRELEALETVGQSTAIPLKEPASTALFGTVSLLDTPFSVSVLGQEIIQEQRAFSSYEVLKNDPAVGLPYPGSRYGYYDTFSLRGFESHNWYSYRVDGLVFANQGENPIENKESLQVLKGAAALRYGYAPPGGVINYVRKRPTDRTRASVSLDLDSHGLVLFQADLGGPLAGEQLGHRTVVAAEEWSSFQDNADGGSRLLASTLLEWRPLESLVVSLGGEYQDLARPYISAIPISLEGRFFDLPVEHNHFREGSRYFVETGAVFGGFSWSIHPDFIVESQTSYNWFSRGDEVQGTFYSYLVEEDGSYDTYAARSGDERRPAFSHQTHAEARFVTGTVEHRFVAGFNFRDLKAYWGADVSEWSVGPSNIFDPVYYDVDLSGDLPESTFNRRVREWGLFATDMIEWNARWRTLLGIRYGSLDAGPPDDLVNATALSPTAALIFKPVPNQTVYGLYTEGLESGGVAPQAAVNANEVLESRITRQAEVGYKWLVDEGRGALTVAGFYIDRPLEYVNAANRYVQDGQQVHYGVEASGSYSLAASVQAFGGFMLLDAEQEETGTPAQNGKRPTGVVRFRGNLGMDYAVPAIEGLHLNMTGYYTGERYATNVETLPIDAFFRLDAGLRYRWQMEKASLAARVNVENLLNETYLAGAFFYEGFGGNATYGAPRTLRFSVTARF
ncbi:MAG: TonB-dependent receptor [Opitutales bacterium]